MGRKKKEKIVHEEIEETVWKPGSTWKATGKAPIDMKCQKISPLWAIAITIALLILAFILITNRWAGKAQAREEHCLCHNVANNPHEVCSDDDSYKQGHQSHLNSGFDTYGHCPVPTATPTPTITPTATPTTTPTPTPIDECKEDCEPTITPTPTPETTPEPKNTGNPGNPPTFAGSSTEPPRCGSENTTKEPGNPHVYRNGDQAIVKWWPTSGNKVHVLYKQNNSSDWQYSLVTDNTGYAEINGLDSMDITFAVQQVWDCGGGLIVSAPSVSIVDGPSNHWVLFR